MIKGRSDLNSVIDGLKKRVGDIGLNLDKGSVKRVGVKFQGEVYKIWPLGFDVEIDAVRTESPARVIFDVTIDDSRVDSPPEPALFDVTVDDSRRIENQDPSSFSVEFVDLDTLKPYFDVSIDDTRDYTPTTFDVTFDDLIIE